MGAETIPHQGAKLNNPSPVNLFLNNSRVLRRRHHLQRPTLQPLTFHLRGRYSRLAPWPGVQ